MKNKTIATGWLVSLGIVLITVLFEDAMGYYLADGFYSLGGIGVYVFGIWGSIKLLK